MIAALSESPLSKFVFRQLWTGIALVLVALLIFSNDGDDFLWRWLLLGVGAFLWMRGWTSVSHPLRAAQYAMNSRNVVLNMIRKWQPAPTTVESGYERSLNTYLQEQLPFVRLTPAAETSEADFDAVGHRDLTIQLQHAAPFLSRRIGLYEAGWKKPIVILLVGSTNQTQIVYPMNELVH